MTVYYRFLKQWPRHLQYRDSTVELAVIPVGADQSDCTWTFRAIKIGQPGECEIFSLRMARLIFESALAEGFPVQSHSPAGKIMEHLARLGYAEKSGK